MRRIAQLHNNIDKTQYFPLQRENILGRSPEANIQIDNKVISRRHARIACAPGSDAYFIEDISARGVYVNFHRVRGRHPLRPGDRICILRFRNIHPAQLDSMTDRDLKDCCDDPRDDTVVAVADLTFEYAEVEESPAEEREPEQPKGLLARLKALFSRR